MKRGMQMARIGYFGKLAARSDFVKAVDNLALASLLDDWLADVMNLLSTDPRWKLNYDATRPLHFAFVGTRSRCAVAGHLVASADSSQRRYPFLGMSAIEVDDPSLFISRCPLIFSPLWDTLEELTREVLAAQQPAAALHTLAGTLIEVLSADQPSFGDFLDGYTVAAMEAILPGVCVRRVILAIALLLEPVKRATAGRLEKSLVLPLPSSPQLRYLVAAFWLDLIVPFLRQADYELSLFLTQLPSLVVGFSGAAPEVLAAIMDPQSATEHQINLNDTGWVDEAMGNAQVQKLSAYLEQGQLSLRSAQALFHETFF
ncbi:type VI secretion system protein ImpM [Duganella sacchari]|uniref:Type VI secretion system protein ImpM n=1 Tax=Duganella sacchari TaxID=551987 RepID=A0A1M7HV93_9BURK|nr:type VI secretion system-associated protein TagF [Duganella sacchari]SHM32390.1 type VI secretion system protein ImpM [Duganella sacchari]